MYTEISELTSSFLSAQQNGSTEMQELLRISADKGASDLHIAVNSQPAIRINGQLVRLTDKPIIGPSDAEKLCTSILTPDQKAELDELGEVDFSYGVGMYGRFRCNVYKQRGTYVGAFRTISTKVRTVEELGVPDVVKSLVTKTKGLVLVTGPTGSGKSTTLAAMIDLINSTMSHHILTLEDPIEYLHKHKMSIIHQREVGADTRSFANALRAALREDPDVILLGEMRDLETISIAISAAETGHLVFATLHTVDAVQTVDRIIDVFPPHQQSQIRVQLSGVLEGVVAQRLVRTKDGIGRVGAFEVLIGVPSVRALIREGKTHQIHSMLQTGSRYGMQTMDSCLAELVNKGKVAKEEALMYSTNPEELQRLLRSGLTSPSFY